MKWFVISCLLGIFSLGIIMVFDTSSAEVIDRSLACSTHKALIKQITYLVVGLGAAAFLYFLGWQEFFKMSPYLFMVLTGALVLVLIPGLGICRNGARRWLGIGHLTLQPSEFMKYILPITAIYQITVYDDMRKRFKIFCKRFILLSIPILLIAIEPDNGSAAVIIGSLIPIFIVTKVKKRFWLLPLFIVIALGAVLAYRMPYVQHRLKVYLNPELDLRGRGHQPYQAKIAAGSGRLFGKGPGASLQKLTYLPEAQNDYIAAIYAEEFGFIGIVVLICLYMAFIYGGFYISMKAVSEEAATLAITITVLIGMQAFLNLGVVSGLLPSKGVNLPFFSQGGSSLIANICGVALLLSVYDKESKKGYISCRGDRRTYCASNIVREDIV